MRFFFYVLVRSTGTTHAAHKTWWRHKTQLPLILLPIHDLRVRRRRIVIRRCQRLVRTFSLLFNPCLYAILYANILCSLCPSRLIRIPPPCHILRCVKTTAFHARRFHLLVRRDSACLGAALTPSCCGYIAWRLYLVMHCVNNHARTRATRFASQTDQYFGCARALRLPACRAMALFLSGTCAVTTRRVSFGVRKKVAFYVWRGVNIPWQLAH